jgi:hypothetical protein
MSLSSDTTTALLQAALRLRDRGQPEQARELLQTIAALYADDVRVWLALVTVAETRDEQRDALERALAIDPQNAIAARLIARFQVADTPVQPSTTPDMRTTRPVLVTDERPSEIRADDQASSSSVEAPVTASLPRGAPAPASVGLPVGQREERQETPRWIWLSLIAVAAMLLVTIVVTQQPPQPVAPARPTPALPGARTAQAPLIVATTAPVAVQTARSPISTVADAPGVTPIATRGIPTPTAAPAQLLAPGVVQQGTWNAGLLRAEDAIFVDGAIGTLQPKGRFVLALIAVGNTSSTPTRIPSDLFWLRDAQGNRYQPLPRASTEYLNMYGRAQRGDLSMEEEIPQGGGNVSIPLIFDVPVTAQNLTLHVGDATGGWPIGSMSASP